jgi:hypothetical protein
MGDMKNAYNKSVGKPEGKGPLGSSRRRWKVNIGMRLRVIAWQVVDWIHLAQDMDQLQAVVNTVMKGRIPKKGNFLIS